MSHSTKVPSISKTTSGLPTDVEDGTTAYDTTQNTLVVRVGGAWEKAGGAGATTPTVVYDDGLALGNTDQIQGDIPAEWKYFDSSLKGLVIGTSCRTIGTEAFNGCTGLTGSLVIPPSVTTLENGVFYDCENLTSAVVPNSVTLFGLSMFQFCTNLTNVDCYITKTLFDSPQTLFGSGVTTIHVRSTDSTWTAGAGQLIGGKSNITVIKDL